MVLAMVDVYAANGDPFLYCSRLKSFMSDW